MKDVRGVAEKRLDGRKDGQTDGRAHTRTDGRRHFHSHPPPTSGDKEDTTRLKPFMDAMKIKEWWPLYMKDIKTGIQ